MLIERIAAWGEATFSPPASKNDLAAAAAALAAALPQQLAELLSETNGVEGEYGLGLVWDVARIVKDNTWFRTNGDYRELYMPFDGLLFFADAGNGDQFGIALAGNHEVYVWDHEDDSRRWVASTVMGYLESWMTGRLKV
jgi:hypothetical protein